MTNAIEKKVRFTRGVKVHSRTLYHSVCGRFVIIKMNFDWPVRSTEYRLTDTKTGKVYRHRADKLAEAKALAQDILNDEID